MSGCHAVITNFYFPRPVTSATEKGSLLVPSHTFTGILLSPFSLLPFSSSPSPSSSPFRHVTSIKVQVVSDDVSRQKTKRLTTLSLISNPFLSPSSLKPPSVLVSLIPPRRHGDTTTPHKRTSSWASFALLLVVSSSSSSPLSAAHSCPVPSSLCARWLKLCGGSDPRLPVTTYWE